MICDVCKKNQADISVEQVVDKRVKHLFLCRDCARKMGFEMFSENIDISVTNLFNKYSTEKQKAEQPSVCCPYCGIKLSDIKAKRKIGCPNCFLYFQQEIFSILKKVKTDLRYTGQLQSCAAKEFTERLTVNELKQKLQNALNAEEYEQAALLRDELKALEKKDDLKA